MEFENNGFYVEICCNTCGSENCEFVYDPETCSLTAECLDCGESDIVVEF